MSTQVPSGDAQGIVIVDDQELFRRGLVALLEVHPEYRVVAQVGSAAEAVAAVQRHRPEIVILELARLGPTGSSLIEQLKQRSPSLRVVVLTSEGSEAQLRDALLKGVDGFLLKDATLGELIAALRNITEGRRYLSPSVSGHLVDSWLSRESLPHAASPLSALTARERSILQLIAEGGSNRSVAERLSVSTKTVEKHRANLMRKLGLRNAGELLMLAVDTGMIEKPGTVRRLVPARVGV